MINIVIVGAGNLGSRHLQALSNISINARISVIDPSESSLKIAKSRIENIPYKSSITFDFEKTLENINKNIDIAVISTTADVRRRAIEDLINRTSVKKMLLEKVLFQKISDYDHIDYLFKQNNIHAWVNCTRRIWPFYKKIVTGLHQSNVKEINISGSLLGLGSNLIHFIDFISFITNTQKYSICFELLDKKIISSKRKGFIDFSGTIYGVFENGTFFSISSYEEGSIPQTIKIKSNNSIIILDEGKIEIGTGSALIAHKRNDWAWQEETFDIPFQSQLTHLVVQQIFQKNSCDLTRYSESVQLHLPMISGLIDYINQIKNTTGSVCAIT